MKLFSQLILVILVENSFGYNYSSKYNKTSYRNIKDIYYDDYEEEAPLISRYEMLSDYISYSWEKEDEWEGMYKMCAGVYQSPIDLDNDDYISTNIKNVLIANVTNHKLNIVAENNGHQLVLWFSHDPDRPVTVILRLTDTDEREYIVSAATFSWAKRGELGAMHYFKQTKDDAEMTIWCRDPKYRTLGQASTYAQGIIAIGIPLDEKRRDQPRWNKMIRAVKHVRYAGRAYQYSDFISNYIARKFNDRSAVLYKGSITFPPCTEHVYHVVVKDDVHIGVKQLDALRKLKDRNNENIEISYRNIRSTNRRKVYEI